MNIDFPSEKFIEDYIFDTIRTDHYCPITGDFVDYCIRQHEIAGYGISDIIKVTRQPTTLSVVVLELKNEPLREVHLSQLARYMTGLRRQLRRYSISKHIPFDICVSGELAGPLDPDKNDLVYMLHYLEGISVYKLALTMECGFEAEGVSSTWFVKSENLRGAKPMARRLYSSGLFKPYLKPGETNTLLAGGLE